MDTVTHGLTGWLLARALPAEGRKKEATAALVVGSLLPDADNIATLLGSEIYLRVHRGLSHGFAGVVVTSLVVALLLYRFGKWKDLPKLYLLALLGQLSHIALDLLNSYGTQIFQPFSDARVSFDILFVIDLVFTGIVLGGILLSRRGAAPARAALAALGVYVLFAGVLHLRAEEAVREAARRHGIPVVSAAAMPRLAEVDVARGLAAFRFAAEARAGEGLASQAQTGTPDSVLTDLPISNRPGMYPLPAGPCAWSGFIDDGETYLRAEVEPFSGAVVWKERVRRGGDLPEVRALADVAEVRTYLWFARFPVVQTSRRRDATVLTFTDLRFGGVPGRRRPFRLQVIGGPDRPLQVRWGS